MLELKSIAEYQNWYDSINQPVVTVYTMGALHDGHAQLINTARDYVTENLNGNGKVVVSIFVNPTQFNNPEDLAKYPRTLAADLAICENASADAVFMPEVSDMYPSGETLVTLTHHKIGEDLEGASRPGHFSGMLTVVNKLLNITKPIATFFGEKDFQQLALVKQMVADLNMPIQVVGVPTVREHDGLAMSSRNRRLDANSRELATQLFAALTLLKHSIDEGHSLTEAKQMAIDYLTTFKEIKLDYLELRNQKLETTNETDSVRALIAAQIGGIRLIDNLTVRD